MKPTSPFVFREITRDDIPAVQSFIIRHLNLYFNAGRALPTASDDVFDLQGNYLERERNQLFGVWNEQQQIIGTLAICQYDDRIEMLHGRYNLPETAEICRCYVDQHYRRQGIGSQLVSLAEQFASSNTIKYYICTPIIFYPAGINSGGEICLTSSWMWATSGRSCIWKNRVNILLPAIILITFTVYNNAFFLIAIN